MMVEKRWVITAAAAVSVVVFGGVNTGANVSQLTVEAYPIQGCISSGHEGYVEKSVADAFVPLSSIGLLVDTSTYPITYTCVTISRTVIFVNPDEIDERSLVDSGETSCLDCMAEWE